MMLIRRLVGLKGSFLSNSRVEDRPTTRNTLFSSIPPAIISRREALARLADSSHGPGETTADRDLGARIRAAVQELPEEQRVVFLLRTEADVPFKEIAKMQGTSINTALARMHYAVLKLRNELKGDYESLARGAS